MSSVRTSLPFALLLALASTASTGSASAAAPVLRVAGEPSATPKSQAAPAWRAGAFPAQSTARLRYGEMSARRILDLQQYNASRAAGKPLQVGIGREAASESAARRMPALQWVARADGSHVARIEFTSPVAYALRVGLKVESLDPRAELRFAGSLHPDKVVAAMSGEQVLALADAERIFWTPVTDGEKQVVELWLPAGARPDAVRVQAPMLTHLMTNAFDDFKVAKDVGNSGACNIDTICRVNELGQGYVDTKSAVARMIFMRGSSGYYCTGTLLNDTDNATQVPYFHTAHHCIDSQTVASTLNTYWNFESTVCNSDVPGAYTLRSGGADFLYSNADTDGALLRLREAAPDGVYFAGWDANVLPTSTAITGIHHPSGDLKKVSFGQRTTNTSYRNRVGWLQGTTEGGSSGSGLFSVSNGSYYLRGGLQGGLASCANSGNVSNSGNYDDYSRLDVDFPSIRQYLAPVSTEPRRRNGSQPLAPRR